jgi:tRNA pseudouridine38-40 synthase
MNRRWVLPVLLAWSICESALLIWALSSLPQDKIRYRARVAYDGSAFSGFQLQKTRPDGRRCRSTVQGELERVLNQRLLGIVKHHEYHTHRGIKVVAASRTDAGVHARGQAIHFDVPQRTGDDDSKSMDDDATLLSPRQKTTLRLPDNENDLERVCDSINKMLTPDIRMWNLQRVPPDCEITKAIDSTTRRALRLEEIHAEDDDTIEMADFQWNVLFDSTKKLYSYRLCLGPVMPPLERHVRWHVPPTTATSSSSSSSTLKPIRLDDLQRVVSHFVGTHDFAAFAGAVERSERKTRRSVSTIRTVFAVNVMSEDEPSACTSGNSRDGTSDATTARYCRIDFVLKGALYKQVRNMVGTAVDVCLGNMSEDYLVRLLKRHELYSRVNNPCKPAPPQGLTLEHVYFEDLDF